MWDQKAKNNEFFQSQRTSRIVSAREGQLYHCKGALQTGVRLGLTGHSHVSEG